MKAITVKSVSVSAEAKGKDETARGRPILPGLKIPYPIVKVSARSNREPCTYF